MWPQLQTQDLGFTSWTGYNNRMLGYLGCIHCRECLFFKSRKKDCCPLRCLIMERWGFGLILYVETSPKLGFLPPPFTTLITFDFNVLLVLMYSMAFGGDLMFAVTLPYWCSPGCLDSFMNLPACRHRASAWSLLLEPLVNRLQGLLEARSATPPASQPAHPSHVLHVLPQSCFSPLKHGHF